MVHTSLDVHNSEMQSSEGHVQLLGVRFQRLLQTMFSPDQVRFVRNYASPENGMCFYRSVAFLLDMEIESVHTRFFELILAGEMFFSGLENEDERLAAQSSLNHSEENRPTIAHILAISKLFQIHFIIFKTEIRIIDAHRRLCVGFMQFISNDLILRRDACPSKKIICLHLRSLNDQTMNISNGHYEPITVNGQKHLKLSDSLISKFQPSLSECTSELGSQLFSYPFSQ